MKTDARVFSEWSFEGVFFYVDDQAFRELKTPITFCQSRRPKPLVCKLQLTKRSEITLTGENILQDCLYFISNQRVLGIFSSQNGNGLLVLLHCFRRFVIAGKKIDVNRKQIYY